MEKCFFSLANANESLLLMAFTHKKALNFAVVEIPGGDDVRAIVTTGKHRKVKGSLALTSHLLARFPRHTSNTIISKNHRQSYFPPSVITRATTITLRQSGR